MPETYLPGFAYQIINILSPICFDLSDEKVLQGQIEKVFQRENIHYKREVTLAKGSNIDFMCGYIGLEIKISGQPKAIYKQCKRYLEFDDVRQLILVTNRTIGMPMDINGKPVFIINLGKAWL